MTTRICAQYTDDEVSGEFLNKRHTDAYVCIWQSVHVQLKCSALQFLLLILFHLISQPERLDSIRLDSTRLDTTRHDTTQHDSRSIHIQLVSRQDCIGISNIFFLVVYDFYICEVVGPLPLCRLIECTFSWFYKFLSSSIAFNTLLMTTMFTLTKLLNC